MIDLRTGVPEDEVAADYEREADAIEHRAWERVVDGDPAGGAELDRAKRLRQEAAERRAARIPPAGSLLPDPIWDRLLRALDFWGHTS